MSLLKSMLLASLLALVFSGCGDSGDEYASVSETPTLKNFIANIDTNYSNIALSLGSVEVLSQGSSNINSFRLEGKGYSNFSISRYGEITTRADTILDCNTSERYDLTVVARNSFGDSNNADAIIQVNCMDVPVLKSLEVMINSYITGNIATMEFIRTGIIDNDPNNDIKYIEFFGDNSGNFNIAHSGTVSLYSPLYSSQGIYDFKVRAVNNNDKVGPYVSLRIYVNNDITSTNVGSDDYPDNTTDVSYTSTYISVGRGEHSIDASMNYLYDYDTIRINLSEEKEISFNLSTNGIYSYGLNSNYIDLYSADANLIGQSSNTTLQAVLGAGDYYVRVSQTSDFYTLSINYDDINSVNYETNTTDLIGNDISTSSYISLNNSYGSNIDYLGDKDMFRFDLPYDANVSVYTLSVIDTYGRLYDVNGTEIKSDDDSAGDGGNFRINIELKLGTYYTEVSAFADNNIGAYELRLEAQ